MYKLDVNKLIDFFGGDTSIVQGFSDLKYTLTINAVHVWRHRQEIPRTVSILLFYQLADARGMKFNLRNFIIGADNGKHS